MKQAINSLILLMTSLFILNCTTLYAAQPKFSIIPTSDSITAIVMPRNFTEEVRYQITNQTKITRTLTMVPIAGVSQITGGGLCSKPFTLAPHQSCTLSLSINGGGVPAGGIHDGPVICKTQGPNNNSPDPFLCSKPATSNTLAISVSISSGQYAYVANQLGNSVTFCQVNPVTGFLSQCRVTATGLAGTEGIGFNPAGTLFYSANPLSSSISICQLNQTNGTLTNCMDAGGSGFNFPDAVTFNPAGTIFYTSNFADNTVSACLVDPSNGTLSSCVNNASVTFSAPSDMTVNAAGTLAYVANRTNNSVSVCAISGQTISACNNLSGSLFNGPEGIILSSSGMHAYITNAGDQKVIVCNVRQDGTGLLDSCTATDGQFRGTGNLALSALDNFAYVPNELLGVFVCNVLVDGNLNDCKPSRGSQFNGAAGIVVH